MKPYIFYLIILFIPIIGFGQSLQHNITTTTIYDTCRTYLYYQQIGSAGFQKQINKARTVQDDGILSVGYISNAVNKNALVFKQDRNGNMLWQKSYGLNGYGENFTGFRELYSGAILTVGTIRNNTTLQEGLLFCKLSADGNLIWQKSYSNFQSTKNIHNGKVIALSDDEAFFAAETDSAIIYGMTDGSGNLLWQKAFRSTAGTQLVDVGNSGASLLIATNSIDSAHHIVKTYYIPYYQSQRKTIASSKRFGGHYNNTNYILHDMEQSSLYSYFSGIRSVNNQPYEFIRLNINQGQILQSMENFITPGITVDTTARSAISIYGDCMAFSGKQKIKEIGIIKMTGSYDQVTNLYWSAKTSWPDSIILNGILKTWDGGYNIYGSKNGSGTDKNISQLKIDSASNTPACFTKQAENFGVLRDHSIFSDTAVYSYVSDSLEIFSTTISVTDITPDTLVYCKELKCPDLPIPDTCVSSFFKMYRSYNNVDFPQSIAQINNSVYICGYSNDMDYQPDYLNTFVAKINADGHILKQKTLRIGTVNQSHMIKTNDSALLFFGVMDSIYYYYPFVAKLDTNLNFSWIKIVPFAFAHFAGGDFGIEDAKQANDGSYFLIANEQKFPSNSRTLLIKLSANGEFMWSKIYRFATLPGDYSLINGRKIILDNDLAYITCSNNYNDHLETILTKVNLTDGSIVWSKRFADPDKNIKVSDFINKYNSELYFTGQCGMYPFKNISLKTDLNGNIIKVKSHDVPTASGGISYLGAQNNDGTLNLLTSYGAGPWPEFDCYVKLNSELDVIYSKKQSTKYIRTRTGITVSSNGAVYETGYGTPPFHDPYYNFPPYLIKFSPEGKLGVCPSDTFQFAETTFAVTTTPVTFAQKDTVFALRIPANYTKQHYLAEHRLVCASVPGCDTLKILGQDTICNSLPVYNYTLYKNNGCNAPVQWDYNPAELQLIYYDDNGISIKFLRKGNIKLKATLYSDCIPHTDSLIVHVYDTPDSLNLGPDTILCNTTSVILKAGRGYKNYLWQNGSTDSLFTATTPGIYFVTVMDSCNTIFTDTINISADTFSPFDIGSDTSKCNNDSIFLQINTGFFNYVWTPPVNMIPISPTTVKVYPDNSIFYYVSARKINGCLLKDSVYVTVNHSPTINLGTDKDLCMNDSLQLNAGSGFNNYMWSTGQVTAFIYARTVGIFYVTATDNNNCQSTDTIKILSLLTLPIVNLTNDTTVCLGQQKTLNAGSGFNGYLWSTGNTTQSISISSTGSYWVRVTDNKGCKNTDTAFIKTTLTPPFKFLLFSDTSLCEYDTISLKTTQIFTNYLWNMGSTFPVITVNNSGLYWLIVTDKYGCVGKDTVKVLPKNCFKEIYFPNTFTPNSDGHNDAYMPKAYGAVDYYHIIIFNRWGIKIFESYDITKGWDGNVAGSKQDNGAYVWICTYRFKGYKTDTQQGSFLLMR